MTKTKQKTLPPQNRRKMIHRKKAVLKYIRHKQIEIFHRSTKSTRLTY